mmetsp:Transcript_11178/g.16767  ORF Transcript_11178/g.16767 Transcript_11178/m.16767 type:complete len:109 (+) Transcript_11178:41-367(+)|eukprot:CAMPEP_0201545800 /NCGR_PEP_ID=MMETSP0173_2-20130828/2228_1 /ASSEMBLY_ACC=CAM_ASM_000268 /TAXON_ID=218659 /ORGANISM="Vexillifera sp., Strain DIVA3 564/2" /LENGTH=108 /DNA_ID=CAMNT_0047954305 /DNA_START=17 /DNA_END=343 /DNA_ORIENTATION=-
MAFNIVDSSSKKNTSNTSTSNEESTGVGDYIQSLIDSVSAEHKANIEFYWEKFLDGTSFALKWGTIPLILYLGVRGTARNPITGETFEVTVRDVVAPRIPKELLQSPK